MPALGEDHPNALVAATNTAIYLQAVSRFGEALALVEDASTRMRVTLDEEHSMSLLASEAADAEERVGALQQAADRTRVGAPRRVVSPTGVGLSQGDELEQHAQLAWLRFAQLLRARSPRTGGSGSAVSGTSSRRFPPASTRTGFAEARVARTAGSDASAAAGGRSSAVRSRRVPGTYGPGCCPSDGAHQAAKQMRKPAEPLQFGGHRPVASSAARVPPGPVVGIGVAVDTDTDVDIEFVEEVMVGVVQANAAGLWRGGVSSPQRFAICAATYAQAVEEVAIGLGMVTIKGLSVRMRQLTTNSCPTLCVIVRTVTPNCSLKATRTIVTCSATRGTTSGWP